jgi:SAM-dependent methyltransferase
VCADCGDSFSRRHGIPSFLTTSGNDPVAREVAAFAESHTEQELFEHLMRDGDERHLASTVFDGLRDDWRLLVPDRLRGRCLDLWTGYGTRALMLADLAESVDAVDPSLDKLRVLAASDHNLSPSVRPVHAPIDRLPFADGTFDTIVADPPRGHNLDDLISRVRQYLDDAGTLVFKLDGPIDHDEFGDGDNTDRLRSITSLVASIRDGPLGGYQRRLNVAFDSVRMYALFPTKTKGQFVFLIDDAAAANHLLADKVDRKFDGVIQSVGTEIASIAVQVGATPHGYLAVCSDQCPDASVRLPEPPGTDGYDRYLIRGQRRAVVVYLDGEEIVFVRKLPKNTRTALYDDRGEANENEHSLLEELNRVEDPIVSTFPNGRLDRTPFGPVRTERPVSGTPVAKRIKRTPKRFRRNLRSGFDWIARFQSVYGGEPIVRSPSEIRDELSVPELDLQPPGVSKPITVFDTPVKSDHSPENLFVDPETDEAVAAIDWEGGKSHGPTYRDPCNYAITLATRTFGDFEAGIESAFVADTPYSDALGTVVEAYTDRLGLEPRGFVTYLAVPYVHKLSTDLLDESRPSIWDRGIVERVEYLWDRQDEIADRLA